MKAGFACKLFGAHQALSGIHDCVVLLHSVVGCNFSTMSFHFTGCDMSDVRQTCTVISDSDIVFNGEGSLRLALDNIRTLYHPEAVFVIQGCVSDIIQDDIRTVCSDFRRDTGLLTIFVEAAGYRGTLQDGYEAALLALLQQIGKSGRSHAIPRVNLIGLGGDDWRLRFDLEAFRALLGDRVSLGTVFGSCTMRDIREAGDADLNLVFGRGTAFAEALRQQFGIPYEEVSYPYGLTGARELWRVLERYFDVDFSEVERKFIEETGAGTQQIYSYLQKLYGIPAAVVGTGARANGLARFLSEELGMEVEVLEKRENVRDIRKFYKRVRESEAALLFGSSFEQELADELEIPLIRFDYPVFDRICISDRPYVGAKGTLCLIEDIFDEIIHGRTTRGALYQ